MRSVTVADLRAIAGGAAPLAAQLVGPINKHCPAVGVDTPLRMSHFLAQICHETGGFSKLVESLNYSVEGLLSTFSRARISKADAQRLGRKKGEKALSQARQREIANLVYGGDWGRKNLGNTGPNDGWDFRGGGPPQLTGRANYRRFGEAAGVDLVSNPEQVRDPDTGIEVAARYFMARMVGPSDRDDVVGVTRSLNGGTKGLSERTEALARAKRVFGYRAATTRTVGLLSVETDHYPEAGEADPIELVEPANADPVDITGLGAPIEDEKTVQIVQEMLRNVGYTEVGTPNGSIGPFTKTAIRAFRAEQDPPLPAGDIIDDQLIAALVRAEPRKLPESRTEATPAQAREVAPEGKANWRNKIIAGFGVFFSGVWTFIDGVIGKITDAKGWLDPIKDFAGDVPGWAWGVGIFAVAAVMYRIAARGDAATIDAVKTGARR